MMKHTMGALGLGLSIISVTVMAGGEAYDEYERRDLNQFTANQFLPVGAGYSVQGHVNHYDAKPSEKAVEARVLQVPVKVIKNVNPLASAIAQDTWSIVPGGLKSQLSAWSDRAGQQLIWKGKQDMIIDANATFKGSYKDAVTTIATSLRDNGVRIYFDMYLGNDVLVIEVSK